MTHRENPRVRTEVSSDTPLEVSEIISLSGLAPRDGSPVHLYSNGIRMMLSDSVNPGQVVEIGTCSLIENMVVSTSPPKRVGYRSGLESSLTDQ